MAVTLVLILPASMFCTHPSHPEVSHDTPSPSTHDASILYLRRAGVAVHLRELELGLRARSLWERDISDHISERLPNGMVRGALARVLPSSRCLRRTSRAHAARIPSAWCGL